MAISGVRGVNKGWGDHWLMLSISIECAQITSRNPWSIASKAIPNYCATVRWRIYLSHKDNIDKFNSAAPMIIGADPNRSAFDFTCANTPLASLDVRLAEWQRIWGDYTDVIHGVRWYCF